MYRGDFVKKNALLCIILSGILWGTTGLFVRILSDVGLSTVQMTAVRGLSAALCFVIYAFFKDKSLFVLTKRKFFFYLLSGACMALTSCAYFLSIKASSVSTAVVLMYTAPIFVMIYSVAFMGEKFTKIKCLALILVMTGSCLVSGIIGGFSGSPMGIIYGLAAGLLYSAYNIFTKIQMKNGFHPTATSMYSFIFMAITALAVSKPSEIAEAVAKMPVSVIFMIGCGVVTCALPYFLYTVSLKFLPVGTAAALGIIEPMAATVFSILLLGERPSVYSITGIVLILVAVFLLSRGEE